MLATLSLREQGRIHNQKVRERERERNMYRNPVVVVAIINQKHHKRTWLESSILESKVISGTMPLLS